MKFKLFVISFNIVIFLSFIMLFLLPGFILDFSFFSSFWSQNWYIAILFLLIFAGINVLYLRKRNILTALENEDWHGLSAVLSKDIITDNTIKYANTKLLLDTLVLLTDFEKIREIESLISKYKPQLYPRFALQFASAAILSTDLIFLNKVKSNLDTSNYKDYEWFLFLEGFLLQKISKNEDAKNSFNLIFELKPNFLLKGLTAYVLLSLQPQKPETVALCTQNKEEIALSIKQKKWERYIEEGKSSMHIALFTKLLNETTKWIYS